MKQEHSLAALSAALTASRLIFYWMLFLAMSLASMFASAGQEIAFVTEIHGNVSIKGRAEPITLPIKLLDSLAIGTIVQLQKKARLVVFYPADAAEYRVQGVGSYLITVDALQSVGQAPVAIKRGLPAVYRDIKVQANSLVQAGIVLRATGKEDDGMLPANENVDPMRIRFQWRGNLAAGTRLELYDDQYALVWATIAVASSTPLPKDIQLVGGRTYRWQLVAPNTGFARNPWATFDVMSAEMAESIHSSRPAVGAPASEYIAFALLLDNLPAPSMAQEIWKELAMKHPEMNFARRNAHK